MNEELTFGLRERSPNVNSSFMTGILRNSKKDKYKNSEILVGLGEYKKSYEGKR